MSAILISGYRSYELQIYRKNDPKLFFLKQLLTDKIKHKVEEGAEWFIISGQLGVELWCGEIVNDLKSEYPEIKLAVMPPYAQMTNQWNELNQDLYSRVVAQADFIQPTSQKTYESPSQLQNNQMFLIQNTDNCLLVMDREYPGKTEYLYDLILKYQELEEYPLEVVDFEELNWFVQTYQEHHPEALKDLGF